MTTSITYGFRLSSRIAQSLKMNKLGTVADDVIEAAASTLVIG